MKTYRISRIIFLYIIILLCIININFTKEKYENSYFIKDILNDKFKIILSNYSIFILLFLKNLDIHNIILNNYEIENLFNKYSKLFDFTSNDVSSIKRIIDDLTYNNFILKNQFFLKQYFTLKQYNQNINFIYNDNQFNFIKKEFDVFLCKNNKLMNEFYKEMIKIIEGKFKFFYVSIELLNIDYFINLIQKNIYYLEFLTDKFFNIWGIADNFENFIPFVTLFISNDNIDEFYVLVHENIHILFAQNKSGDFIFQRFKEEIPFDKFELLLVKDQNYKIAYNYRGNLIYFDSIDDFYFKFIYKYFNEFLAHTFSSYIINNLFNKIKEEYLYIYQKYTKDSIINFELYKLQNFLINKNIFYNSLLTHKPSNEDIYEIFLLFLYSQIYNFEYTLKKINK